MIKSFFTIAKRHLFGHKLFSLLNIFCLAIGITFSLLIGIYIVQMRQVNASIANADNQYVLKSIWKQQSMGFENTTLAPLAKTLQEEYPSLIQNFYRFTSQQALVQVNNTFFKQEVAICDTSLISMFALTLKFGNPAHAFVNSTSAIISESFAIKYFGTANAIGKSLQIIQSGSRRDQKASFIISAVIGNVGKNVVTDYYDNNKPLQIFIPFLYDPNFDKGLNSWKWSGVPSFIQLKNGVHISDVIKPIEKILAVNIPDVFKNNISIEPTGLDDYFMSENDGRINNITTILILVGFFILIMAILNFINIVLGNSEYRLKEIGIRKYIGTSRRLLVAQFLCEAYLFTFLAAILSLIFYECLRPFFSDMLDTPLEHLWNFRVNELVYFLLLILSIGFLAGVYPAFVISKTPVLNAVKGKFENLRSGIFLKKLLLIVQFTIALIIFISSLHISKQLNLFLNRNLGYDKSNLLVVSTLPNYGDSANSYLVKAKTFENELQGLSNIESCTISFEIPNGNYSDNLNLTPEGSTSNEVLSLPYMVVDKNFLQTYKIQLTEGNFLSETSLGAPASEIVINESAAKSFGWDHAVGKKVKLAFAGIYVTVVGVVKDFNFSSLHKPIEPIAIVNLNSFKRFQYFTIKYKTDNPSDLLQTVQEKWKAFFPEDPFDYVFLDENLKTMYQPETQLKEATTIATIMDLIIVFLGIFGIVLSSLNKRSKEIALRKVIGASTKDVIVMILKEYAYLVLVANVISWPIAYILINKWLNHYPYRIEQSFEYYALCGLIVFCITASIIILQCYKYATLNLIKVLRSD